MSKTKKSFSFTIRRIANRNPRHARNFQRGHKKLFRLGVTALLLTFVVSGLFVFGGVGFVPQNFKTQLVNNSSSSIGVGDTLRSVGSVAGEITGGVGSIVGGAIGGLDDGLAPIGGLGGAIGTGLAIKGAVDAFEGDDNLGVAGAVFNGPGSQKGLQNFAYYYSGNKYGSAIGMITGWTNFTLPFVSVLAIAALIYAGFLYITAFGNQEQTGKAKKILIWVVLGIILIFSAYALVNTVLSGSSAT